MSPAKTAAQRFIRWREQVPQPLSDDLLMQIAREEAGSSGVIRLTRDVGPYEVTQPTHVYRVIAHRIVAAAVAGLRAERDALQKDAERYRWLRAQHWDSGLLAVVADPKAAVKLGHECPSLGLLDEQIDAAMLAQRVVTHKG